ncbi:MAG: hypothetical protein GY750_16365 [Lentisphaerae bacterium]|nr:hypothetical protein [Lentisphaerota bacterium]MCP4102971.1 hypothetical protein [Lentisphaerota bacterium]
MPLRNGANNDDDGLKGVQFYLDDDDANHEFIFGNNDRYEDRNGNPIETNFETGSAMYNLAFTPFLDKSKYFKKYRSFRNCNFVQQKDQSSNLERTWAIAMRAHSVRDSQSYKKFLSNLSEKQRTQLNYQLRQEALLEQSKKDIFEENNDAKNSIIKDLNHFFNYVFHEKYLKSFTAEEMMLCQIKWHKNMQARFKLPKNYLEQVHKLEKRKNIDSGYGFRFNYDKYDIVDYFLKDGMELPGNANGFIKSKGIGWELVANTDVAKILSPWNYLSEIQIGNIVSCSAYASPTSQLALGVGYEKNPALFMLQVAFPNNLMLGLYPNKKITPSYFLSMKAFRIKKRLAASFCLGAKAVLHAQGPHKENTSMFDDFSDVSYNSAALVEAKATLEVCALEASGKYEVEDQLFIGDQAAYFKSSEGIRKSIVNDVCNAVLTYNSSKHYFITKAQSIFTQNNNEKDKYAFNRLKLPDSKAEIYNFHDYSPYIHILTTSHSHQVDLGMIKSDNYIKAALSSEFAANNGDGKYLSSQINNNKLEATGMLAAADASAQIYRNKGSYKGRKYRLFIPFIKKNLHNMSYVNQDTEIVYTKQRSCSYLGFSASLNRFCSLELKYDFFNDPMDADWIGRKQMVSDDNAFTTKEKAYVQNKSFKKALYENEYFENSLSYKSITSIIRDNYGLCDKSSSYNVGKSTDITPIILFYDIYYEALKNKYIKNNMKNELQKKKPRVENCLNYNDSVNLFYNAQFVLTSAQEYGDVVQKSYSVKKFKKKSSNGLFKRRVKITAVDKALKKYWSHIETFSKTGFKKATSTSLLKEINDRIGLLKTIKLECVKWINSHYDFKKDNYESYKKLNKKAVRPKKSSLVENSKRYEPVKKLIKACNNSICHYEYSYYNNRKFKAALLCEKLFALTDVLDKIFESINISKELGINYIIPGKYSQHIKFFPQYTKNQDNNNQPIRESEKSCQVIGLLYDLFRYENIKAVIFEAVFQAKFQDDLVYDTKGVYYTQMDLERKVQFKNMKLPFKSMEPAKMDDSRNDNNNIGIRLYYRREDFFENRKYIFQLGTRLMPVQSREKLDINLGISYQYQQSSFTAVSLFSATNPNWKKQLRFRAKNQNNQMAGIKTFNLTVDDFFKTILIS